VKSDFCRKELRLKAAFLDQVPQLRLEGEDIFLGGAVVGSVWIEAGAARLIEHPNGRFAIAEGDFTADEGTGEREGVHRGGYFSSGDERRFLFFFRFQLEGFYQLDAQIKDQESSVHVGERVAEVLFEVALEVRHGGTFRRPLFKGFFLFGSELAGAEHGMFVNDACALPSSNRGRDEIYGRIEGRR